MVEVVTTADTAVLCFLHLWPDLSAAPVTDGKWIEGVQQVNLCVRPLEVWD